MGGRLPALGRLERHGNCVQCGTKYRRNRNWECPSAFFDLSPVLVDPDSPYSSSPFIRWIPPFIRSYLHFFSFVPASGGSRPSRTSCTYLDMP